MNNLRLDPIGLILIALGLSLILVAHFIGCTTTRAALGPADQLDVYGQRYDEALSNVSSLCFDYEMWQEELLSRYRLDGDSTYWHYQSGIESLEINIDKLCKALD